MATTCPPAVGEAQLASLNGTAFYGAEYEYQPDPRKMTRRSISIFSRRGPETPEPKSPFTAQAAMPTFNIPLRQMTAKQKSWMRRRSTGGGKAPKLTKGTILNLVPSASTIQMSRLEEMMATSPNDEILTAISERASTQFLFSDAEVGASPTKHDGRWTSNSALPGGRTKSQKKLHNNSQIGVWVNGVVQWTDEVRNHRAAALHDLEASVKEEMGFTPVLPLASGRPAVAKPNLSVLIPGNEHIVNHMSLSTVIQPKPHRPLISVAPASMVSEYAMRSPAITLQCPSNLVSPLETLSGPPTTSPHRLSALDHMNVEDAQALHRPKPSRTPSSTSSSLLEHDDSSMYSKRSSATSIEAIAMPAKDKGSTPEPVKRTSSKAFSIISPAEAGVFDEAALLVNKPLPGVPCANTGEGRASTKSKPGGYAIGPLRLGCLHLKATRSLTQLDVFDQEFMDTSPYCSDALQSTTPSLNQAEDELHAHLSTIAEDNVDREQRSECGMTKSASLRRNDSVHSVMHPPERAPTVPRRSRKRDWRKCVDAKHIASQIVVPQKSLARRKSESGLRQAARPNDGQLAVQKLRSSRSASEMPGVHCFTQRLPTSAENRLSYLAPLPGPSAIVIDDGLCVVDGPMVLCKNEVAEIGAVSCTSAEDVLLHILASLTSLNDLVNTAMMNKGMYRVYKENEMQLIRTIVLNYSPPAWESHEWTPPDRNQAESSEALSQLEHTPITYMRSHRHDVAVIQSLKGLILGQCQTFIQRETVFALSTPQHPIAHHFDDAFWRIWCFCKIFGCEKGREDDVTGQLDWLKGGLLANNQGCVATVNTNLDFEMTSVLLNPPEHFAKGNVAGLDAQQLFDMTEIWTCLAALLGGLQGRVDQARDHGVFAICDIVDGDVEREELMLEEWIAYLLTLGPAVVLEMAEYAGDSSSTAFALAQQNGWTDWTPPIYNGSRSTFLKEPVARLYEERVAAAALKLRNPHEVEKKEMSRKRVASLAAEIRLRRQTSGYKRLPLIDMSMERPMSVVTRHDSSASISSNSSNITITRTVSRSPQPYVNFSAPRRMSPNAWSPHKISPIIEGRVETFNRLSLNNLGGVADATAERAVQKIVDMGFTERQAKDALRVTDMGDGLRVDRAVDLLLRKP